MDIGADFEDDFFEKPKKKLVKHSSNYEIKVCKPLWFMDPKLNLKDTSEVLVALKHQADYHYVSKSYSKAIEMYERCMKLVPDNNNTWKREFMENLTRSLLQVGDAEKALEWSLKLHEAATSPDQGLISMNLLATVCHALGKYEEELEALHTCVEVHQSCPELWYRLGLCYAGLFNIYLPEYSIKRTCDNDSETEVCCLYKSEMNSFRSTESQENSSTSVKLVDSSESAIAHKDSSVISEDRSNPTSSEVVDRKCQTCRLGTFMVSSCFIRTRALIDSGGPNLLGMERDESIKEKIAKSLNHMEIDQPFIDAASQSLGLDFLPGLRKPDETSKDSSETSTSSKAQEFSS